MNFASTLLMILEWIYSILVFKFCCSKCFHLSFLFSEHPRPKPTSVPNHNSHGPKPYVPPHPTIKPEIPLSKPIRFEIDNVKHLLNPESHSNTSPPPFTTPSYPIITDLEEIPHEFSQNPNHISVISEYALFYDETDKFRGKPKLVDGDLENYRPRPIIP